MKKLGIEKVQKAYKNGAFLASPAARTLRILSEFLEPQSRFNKYGIYDTIVFFGSARARPENEVKAELRKLEGKMKSSGRPDAYLRHEFDRLMMELRLSKYYEDACELARRLTLWAKKHAKNGQFSIVSGGGPGIMEAANRGAHTAKGTSIGLNISLPFEQKPNPYITRGLNFEFHYFFMRKLWFAYLARALVFFPGGFGTIDELFELLTLKQTRKITKRLPIVLYGTEYWDDVVDLHSLVRWGTISKSDLKLIKFADSVEEAYNYIVDDLKQGRKRD